jgi:hypothetical protein
MQIPEPFSLCFFTESAGYVQILWRLSLYQIKHEESKIRQRWCLCQNQKKKEKKASKLPLDSFVYGGRA